MKIFISWSGTVSRCVAEAFREWLPSVLQYIEPYVSSEDIDKGARWSTDISTELEESTYGIICVTPENLNAPWLNFEAGALSKSFDKGRVSPFLFHVERSEITGPLLQFQSTIYERNDLLKLIKSIDSASEAGLGAPRVETVFDVWWPRLDESLKNIINLPPETEGGPARTTEDVLGEILDLVRAQQKLLSDPANIIPSNYILSAIIEPPRTVLIGLERLQLLIVELRRQIEELNVERGDVRELRNVDRSREIVMSLSMEFDSLRRELIDAWQVSIPASRRSSR